jgi:signal peptidase I
MAFAEKVRAYARELGLGLLLRKDPERKPEVPMGAGRRQLEGFAVAIAMALMLKQFTFDTFQVPTESMEPAIIGRGDMGDRLLVDRFAYMFSDPERYDIVVFKYPLSRLVNYVKRAVGLPGETVKLFHGDVYAAPRGGRDFKVTRKPDSVQEAIFRSNPVIPAEGSEDFTSAKFFRYWDAEDPDRRGSAAGVSFDAGEASVVLSADAGKEGLVRTKDPITDARHDPKAADAKGKAGGRERVGDVRILTAVTPRDCDAVILEIEDPVLVRQPLRLEVAVEGRAGETKLLRGTQSLTPQSLQGRRLPNRKKSRVDLQHADDRLIVRIDCDEVARVDYEMQPVDSPAMNTNAVARVGVRGGAASFSKIGLERDLYYTKFDGVTDEFEVPEGQYLMLGDNSPNSLDARGWKRSRIRVRQSREDEGVTFDGDFEAVSDRIENSRRMRNPYPDDDGTPAFIDVFGNERHLKPGLFDVLDPRNDEVRVPAVEDVLGMPDPTQYAVYDHYVPRRYIVGRAAIVFFWPIRILR